MKGHGANLENYRDGELKRFAEDGAAPLPTPMESGNLAHVPVVVAHAEQDEFIKREHGEYLAETTPNARYLLLPGVSHFAPLQRPSQFNAAILSSLVGFWKDDAS